MNKKRNLAVSAVIYAVLLGVVNLLVFLIFREKNVVFWISYAFMMAAFAVQAAAMFLSFRKADIQTAFFGIPLASLSIYYLCAEQIIGFIFMFFQGAPTALAAVIQILLLAAFIVIAAIALWARDTVIDVNNEIKQNVQKRNLRYADVEILMNSCGDASLKEALRKAAETVKYSDPMGNAAVADVEVRIEQKYIELRSLVEDGKTDDAVKACREFESLWAERNTKLKYVK